MKIESDVNLANGGNDTIKRDANIRVAIQAILGILLLGLIACGYSKLKRKG